MTAVEVTRVAALSLLLIACADLKKVQGSRDSFVRLMALTNVTCDESSINEGGMYCSALKDGKPAAFTCYETHCSWRLR